MADQKTPVTEWIKIILLAIIAAALLCPSYGGKCKQTKKHCSISKDGQKICPLTGKSLGGSGSEAKGSN